MDEKQLLARVQYLSHKLFIANSEGKEYIRLMKMLHIQTPTFPQKGDVIECHGGPLAWAAFREGQLTLLRSIDVLARNYEDKIEAEQKTNKEWNV